MNDLYIIHYGVGHDKGGHSGRYPWGSGDNPYGGVNFKTRKRDLVILNNRKFNDVAADLIVKYKNNEYIPTEGEVASDKAKIEAFFKNAEALSLGMLASSVFGIAGTLGLRAYYTARDFKEANKFVDEYDDVNINKMDGYYNSIKEDHK